MRNVVVIREAVVVVVSRQVKLREVRSRSAVQGLGKVSSHATADRSLRKRVSIIIRTAAGNSLSTCTQSYNMRLLSSICVLLWTLFAFVQAKSATGDRVLVVLEDVDEKSSYSQLWADLECEKVTE